MPDTSNYEVPQMQGQWHRTIWRNALINDRSVTPAAMAVAWTIYEYARHGTTASVTTREIERQSHASKASLNRRPRENGRGGPLWQLIELGWLTIAKKGAGRRPNTYALTFRPGFEPTPDQPPVTAQTDNTPAPDTPLPARPGLDQLPPVEHREPPPANGATSTAASPTQIDPIAVVLEQLTGSSTPDELESAKHLLEQAGARNPARYLKKMHENGDLEPALQQASHRGPALQDLTGIGGGKQRKPLDRTALTRGQSRWSVVQGRVQVAEEPGQRAAARS